MSRCGPALTDDDIRDHRDFPPPSGLRRERRAFDKPSSRVLDYSSVTAERDNQMTLRACQSIAEFNKQELDIGAYHGWWQTTVVHSFTCPNCQALYHVVKVEAGPETVFQDVTCGVRGEPLVGREGEFVLKYFLLRKAGRVQKGRRTRIVAQK